MNNQERKDYLLRLGEDTLKRAPAFYGEVFYSEEEASRARKGAAKIKEFVETLLKSLEE